MTYQRLAIAAMITAQCGWALGQNSDPPKYSSREEMRNCLNEADGLKKQLEPLQQRSKRHEADLKYWQDQTKAHVATQDSLDTRSESAVDAFNKKVQSLNARVEELNAQADRLRQETDRYNTLIAAANKKCAGMVVTMDDHDAVMKERSAQGRKP